jgi:hypothetical protein
MRVIRKENVTYHLNEDTAHDYNSKDICTNMCQLIIPRKSQFESDTKALHISAPPNHLPKRNPAS